MFGLHPLFLAQKKTKILGISCLVGVDLVISKEHKI